MLIAGHEIQGIGLGTAQFAFRNRTAEDCVATVHAALDAGVTLIDTALAYTRTGIESYAEQVIARALRGLTTGRPLVATKGGHWRRGDSFPVDGRPGTLRAHCEISLRNLEVDRIDLYQLHHVDPHVPLPDSVGALGQLRQEGKIADIGLSNVTIAQLDQALAVAPITAVQNRLSYGDPGDLPMALACAERGVAYLAYSPFNGPAGLVPQAALATASRRGVSAHRVLLAWLRRQSPNIVPLAGASRAASIRDSAARLDLTDSDLEGLGAVPQGQSTGQMGTGCLGDHGCCAGLFVVLAQHAQHGGRRRVLAFLLGRGDDEAGDDAAQAQLLGRCGAARPGPSPACGAAGRGR